MLVNIKCNDRNKDVEVKCEPGRFYDLLWSLNVTIDRGNKVQFRFGSYNVGIAFDRDVDLIEVVVWAASIVPFEGRVLMDEFDDFEHMYDPENLSDDTMFCMDSPRKHIVKGLCGKPKSLNHWMEARHACLSVGRLIATKEFFENNQFR